LPPSIIQLAAWIIMVLKQYSRHAEDRRITRDIDSDASDQFRRPSMEQVLAVPSTSVVLVLVLPPSPRYTFPQQVGERATMVAASLSQHLT